MKAIAPPTLLLAILGAAQLAQGVFMAAAPGTFFEEIGPFGAPNDHYVRDAATFTIALGVVLLIAAWRPSWRVPVLAYALLQFGLHAVNHLVDIGEADPEWVGVADLAALTLGTALLAWMLVAAARAREAPR